MNEPKQNSRRGIISLDLASFTGAEYIRGNQLDRNDKCQLELKLANECLQVLDPKESPAYTNIESNPNDPPDVTFSNDGIPHGMELCEILPPNRLESDAIIRGLKRNLVSRLRLSQRTKDQVINIGLADCYADKIRPGAIEDALAKSLNHFFEYGDDAVRSLEVPASISTKVTRITLSRTDLTNDLRINDPCEPLIIFDAQATQIYPDEDCPRMVETLLARKRRHYLNMPTWLLLWSDHSAIYPVLKELNDAIKGYIDAHELSYERIFHLHRLHETDLKEFNSRDEDRK